MTTSITDKPITSKLEEALDIEDYSNALVDFISDCATPLTIGIQGEWGSGKTSIMYLIKNELDIKNVATSWVNTWEFSMFRTTAETTPAVMNGLLQKLKIQCGDKWTLSSDKLKNVTGLIKKLENLLLMLLFTRLLGKMVLRNHLKMMGMNNELKYLKLK